MVSRIENNLSFRDNVHFALMRGRGISIETRLEGYRDAVRRIEETDLSGVSEGRLRILGEDLKGRIRGGESPDDLLVPAFALVREVCRRVLNQVPFTVQLLAGVVLHQGKLAQMKTGEGKTLAAVFPVYLNALSGRGVHVMTANDYLARRDALWMGKVYGFLGLNTGYIQEKMSLPERREAYAADVTYLTAKQGGFDFLRDRLCYRPKDEVQREPYMVIVDEADFIMIDEARIPLVIASPEEGGKVDPYGIDRAVRRLQEGRDFIVDRNRRNCGLTIEGERRVQELLGCGGMHDERFFDTYAGVHVALHAAHLLSKDVDYVVKGGSVELVDEFTGRIADKRRWPYGIQTALEVKEGLAAEPEGKIRGSITIQNFIARYPKIAAMTATAAPAAEEFLHFYGLPVVIIPPNRPERMVHAPDRVFLTAGDKTNALIREICDVHAAGRPVLVGTRSVRESEDLAGRLERRGVRCRVLNAKNDEQEASLIAEAGKLGAVTISTNMAGRGTDIKLGGEDGTGKEEILRLGGLYVIGTNKHESSRVDNQLRGRAGRQGDPGLSTFFVSLEDDIMVRYGIREFIPLKVLEKAENGLISDCRVAREIDRAQRIIESQHFEMRRTLHRYTLLIEKQRRTVQSIRREALDGRLPPLERPEGEGARSPERGRGGNEGPNRRQIRLFLSLLDEFWADHLAFVDDIREGIHLQRYAGIDPILVFLRQADGAFDEGLNRVYGTWEREVESLGGEAEDEEELIPPFGPSNTWTYLINDNPFPPFSLSSVAHNNIGSSLASAVVILLRLPEKIAIYLYRRIKGRLKR